MLFAPNARCNPCITHFFHSLSLSRVSFSRFRGSDLSGDGLRRSGRHFEARVLGHHALEADTDTFDDGEQDCTANGTVAHGLVAATDR